MEPEEFLTRRLVVRRRDFLAEGFTPSQYQRLQREHDRVRHGVLAHREAPPDVRAAASLGGALTCVSAAARLGLWVRRTPRQAHVAVIQGDPTPGAVIAHRRYADRGIRGALVLPLAEVCAHALGCLPPAESIPLVESAVVTLGLSTADVLPLLGTKTGPARRYLRRVRGTSESILEVNLRLLLEELGVRYVAQAHLPGIGRVDFLVEGYLIIEADGYEFHGNREQWRRDMDRTNQASAGHFVTLRFRAEQIWNDPDGVKAQVAAVLARLR
ncbi:endonuclease domain-containing protein [Zhihengliuella flava]|uniref:Very-short-patch-repair endonuclease n=1 Tax=Zhihengliuella flava TaxID=1285193 RepID=A0A931DE22_9MICC|nr:DUF559 domain-containing protein [Zhihengliuella flava]MBG6085095.1 very-short-patch-repair endonuclease [Zhihengliuella flava]